MNEMRILLIEDEEWYAEPLLLVLHEYGARNLSGGAFNTLAPPRHATNQADASRAASDGDFDLVILDLVYPATDSEDDKEKKRYLGIEFLPELRRLQPAAAIVILTAHPDLQSLAMVVQSIRDYQADDFVPKTADLKTEILPRFRVAWEHAQSRRWVGALQREYYPLVRSRAARVYAEIFQDVIERMDLFRGVLARRLATPPNTDCTPASDIRPLLEAEADDLCQGVKRLAAPFYVGMEPRKKRTDLNGLIHLMRQFYEKLFYEVGVRLTVANAGDAPIELSTYEGDLKVALFEITQNAIDSLETSAAAPGGREVRFELSPEKTGVRVSITDNGGGFSDDAIENMYKPGFTTREDGRHQGLGLYIAKRMMAAIGGEIKAYNSGSGSATVELLVRDLGENK
jgi:anti-sigma regulatory factor (Ser/Thr protein kinase)/CheY-like chemotaxis protein